MSVPKPGEQVEVVYDDGTTALLPPFPSDEDIAASRRWSDELLARLTAEYGPLVLPE